MSELALAKVVVPERHRRKLGDLVPLSASIREIGLLHPIVVRSDGTLIAGQRRLEAFRLLGRTSIPVNYATTLDSARAYLLAERDENVCRLDMTPSEKVSLGRALEELERPKAAERKAATQPNPGQRVGEEKFSSPTTRGDRTGKTYDLVGESVGMSGVTYQRAKAVVVAAEQGDPIAVRAREEMDASGKVAGAWEKVRGDRRPVNGNGSGHAFKLSPGRMTDVANTNKARVWSIVSSLDGLATGLSSINLSAALAVTEAGEVDEMTELLGKSLADLRRFRAALIDGRNSA